MIELGRKTNTKLLEEWKPESCKAGEGPVLMTQSPLVSDRPVVATGGDG